MNKRGIFFSLTAILLISVILVAFLIRITDRTDVEISRTNLKGETLSSFAKSFNEEFAATAIETSSNRALKSFLNRIEKHEKYMQYEEEPADRLDGLIKRFNRLIWEGKEPNDEKVEEMQPLSGEDYTLKGTFSELIELARQSGIKLEMFINVGSSKTPDLKPISTLAYNDIQNKEVLLLKQDEGTGPFYVNVSISKVYVRIGLLSDSAVYYSFDNICLSSLVSLSKIDDPVWKVNKKINVNMKEMETSGGVITLENFKRHIVGTTFFHYDDAPRFLDRLVGNLGEPSPCCGVMSVLNPNDFDYNSGCTSMADYQYFGTKTQGNLVSNSELQLEFACLSLDANQIIAYNGGDAEPLTQGGISCP